MVGGAGARLGDAAISMTSAMLVIGMLPAGCATSFADLRERPPVRSGVVLGAYHSVAVCTVDGANSLAQDLILASASDHVY